MTNQLARWLRRIGREHPKDVLGGLARVREVAERAGINPPAPRNVIVGGTNGKGSTTIFLEQLLLHQGVRVGATLSPHVHRFNERFRIDGAECDDAAIVAALIAVDAARGDVALTYFEYALLAALTLFRDAEVDVAVLEVGLGGRLDAVNIVDADVTVITSIGIDHVDYLGDTREAIGYEKAGIMRAGVPLVYGEADPPHSIRRRAEELSAPVYLAGCEFSWQAVAGHTRLRTTSGSGHTSQRTVDTLAIAPNNAATALQAAELLNANPRAIDDALIAAAGTARVPGRFEIVPHDQQIWVLDVAHNPHGAAFLNQQLRERFPDSRVHALFGTLTDKPSAKLVAALDAVVASWTFTSTRGPRGLAADELAARAQTDGVAIDDLDGALAAVQSNASRNDVILVCGSFDLIERTRAKFGVELA